MITLTITQASFDLSIHQKTVVIGPQGGSVGRSDEGNILIIPDVNISRHHFTISCPQGDYLLSDTSTNGTFVNDKPVTRNSPPVIIRPGDCITIGQTVMTVEAYSAQPIAAPSEFDNLSLLPGLIDSLSTETGEDSLSALASDSLMWPENSTPLPEGIEMDLVGHDNLLDSLTLNSEDWAEPEQSSLSSLLAPEPERDVLSSLLNANDSPASGPNRLPEFGNSIDSSALPIGDKTFISFLINGIPDAPVTPAVSKPVSTTPAPAIAERPKAATPSLAARPSPAPVVAPESPRPMVSTPAASDLQAALAPLLGEHAARLSNEQCLNVVSMMALALHHTISGMMDGLASRERFKNEQHLNRTMIQRVDNNPLKFSPSPDNAIETMFVHCPKGYLSAPDAFREGIEDILSHQNALLGAIGPATQDTLKALFSVQAIEQKAEQSGLSGFAAFNKKGKLWDVYCEHANALLGERKDKLEQTLMQHVSNRYDQNLSGRTKR